MTRTFLITSFVILILIELRVFNFPVVNLLNTSLIRVMTRCLSLVDPVDIDTYTKYLHNLANQSDTEAQSQRDIKQAASHNAIIY